MKKRGQMVVLSSAMHVYVPFEGEATAMDPLQGRLAVIVMVI